jgi:elongation factor P
MVEATKISKGQVIFHNDALWRVLESTPAHIGKKGRYMQIKMKRLDDGHIETNRFSSDDDIETAYIETRKLQYLYPDGQTYVFMDPQSGEQYHLGQDVVEDALPYMTYNTEVKVEFHEDRPLRVNLPPSVVLEVTQTEPAVKGDTATDVTKPATLETGKVVKVPGHIEKGAQVKVDTRTGEFQGKA